MKMLGWTEIKEQYTSFTGEGEGEGGGCLGWGGVYFLMYIDILKKMLR